MPVTSAASAIKAGTVAHFAASSAPEGWIKANGAAISRATYEALFLAIGTTHGAGDGSTTFNIPDLRGEFLRSWDDGRGVDFGRGIGTLQSDDLKSHQHSIPVSNSMPGGPMLVQYSYAGQVATANTNAIGGSETRPRNVALLACIKY